MSKGFGFQHAMFHTLHLLMSAGCMFFVLQGEGSQIMSFHVCPLNMNSFQTYTVLRNSLQSEHLFNTCSLRICQESLSALPYAGLVAPGAQAPGRADVFQKLAAVFFWCFPKMETDYMLPLTQIILEYPC